VTFTWDGDTLCEQTTSLTGSADSVALTWDHDGVKPVTQVERRLSDQSEDNERIEVPEPDIEEIKPDLSRLPKRMR
jgi:hypothetical protein